MRHVIPVLLLLAACSDGDDAGVASSPCMDETRAGTLEIGASIQGDAGSGLSIEVTDMDPAPPEVGLNDWTLSVDGVDAEGCLVEVATWMPDHQHGSDQGTSTFQDGVLTIEDLQISMGGVWEVTITATCGDEDVREATLSLCVDA